MAGKQVSHGVLAVLLVGSLPALGAWRMAGPFGGSARALAVDPQNRNTLLAGARDSLLFRSDDAGATWRLLPFPAGTPGTFNALIIDPKVSNHFYAGLDAGDSPDSGLYESRDGGEHWEALAGLRGFRIESLALSRSDSQTLAAGTSHGVFLSNEGGQNWRRVSNPGNPEMQDITALAFDPADSSVIYAGTPHLPWKSSDGGANWHSIATGLIDDSDIFSIYVDLLNPRIVLASACSGVYRSENGGEAWTKLRGIPGTHRRTHVIAEDPGNADVIYAGTTLGLFISPDAGASWEHLNSEQVNWMAFDPEDDRTLYLATEYAGVLKSADSGKTFSARNRGFVNQRLTQITGTGERMFATSTYEGSHGGVFASVDGGLVWTLRANQDALLGRNLQSLVAVSVKREVLFGTNTEDVLKSTDGGKTWTRLAIQPKFDPKHKAQHFGRLRIQCLAGVESDRLVLLLGTQSGLFRSVDGGTSWERVISGGIAEVPVFAVYTPARGASRLLARTSTGLFVSVDAGRAWSPVALPASDYFIYDIGIPADREAPILAATSRGLLQSFDDGANWKLVTGGVPGATVTSVRFNPNESLEAYLVQFNKLYRSSDGGSTWQPMPGPGLENSAVHALWLSPGRIVALSAARGALVYEIPQPDVAGRAEQSFPSSKNR